MFRSIANWGRTAVTRALLDFAVAVPFALGQVATAAANGNVIQVSALSSTQLKVAKGKPRTIRTSQPFYEIVIGDPEIANVTPLTDRSFYVLGSALGTTGIALFDENKTLVGTIDVEVTLDADRLASTIREAVPGTDIKVKSANGRLVLSGTAKDAVAADKANQIANRFSGEEEIINSVDIASSQQVQLNVRVVEVNRQVTEELGAKYAANFAYGLGGRSVILDPDGGTIPEAGTGEIIGSFLSNGFSIDVAIKALEDRGLARRLAEPNLIARSGEKASFLAGGEFPIPVASGEDGTITVEYKRFGVSLDFMPTVLSDGLISLDIQPEVSSVDTSASYQVGNIAIPGFVVRRAHTSVDLKSGQSFMIAGLLQTQNDTGNQRVPGVGKMPVLGALFSSKAYQRRETELVIIITPHLVKPIDPSKKVATPADATKPASNADFFLGNVEEVPRAAAGRALSGAVATATKVGHFLELSDD